MSYKVIYHVGHQVDSKTKFGTARLAISQDSVCLSGAASMTVPLNSITGVHLLRPHPRASLMVKLLSDKVPIFLSVLFLKLFKDAFVTNQDGTIQLYDHLKNRCTHAMDASANAYPVGAGEI